MAKAKQQKSSNLSLATVKKVSKKLDQTLEYVIETGDYIDEKITFSPLFNDVQIEELLTEFGMLVNEAEKNEIKLSQNMQLYLIYILIIKHFTHFKKDIPNHLLNQDKSLGVLEILEHFRKTGLLYECINKMFLPQETSKVLSRMTDVAATGLLAMNLNEEMMKKLQDLREKNNEVFKKLDEINIDNDVVQ